MVTAAAKAAEVSDFEPPRWGSSIFLMIAFPRFHPGLLSLPPGGCAALLAAAAFELLGGLRDAQCKLAERDSGFASFSQSTRNGWGAHRPQIMPGWPKTSKSI
jgi:hypothetical protein